MAYAGLVFFSALFLLGTIVRADLRYATVTYDRSSGTYSIHDGKQQSAVAYATFGDTRYENGSVICFELKF